MWADPHPNPADVQMRGFVAQNGRSSRVKMVFRWAIQVAAMCRGSLLSVRTITTLLIAIWIVFLTLQSTAFADEFSAGEKLFALRLKDLFAEKCNACHGEKEDEIEGGFNMLSRDSMLKGGESFGAAVLQPGNGNESMLYVATTRVEEGYEMPPKESEALTKEQSWMIRDWIDAGAPWPSSDRVAEIQSRLAEGEVVQTSGGLSADWTNRRYEPNKLWAFRPLSKADVPENVHPVDWFIEEKLKQANLPPADDASAGELARRLSFGIKGLPPSIEEVRAFSQHFETDPDAAMREYGARWMASPHYGEHFGRLWLDVARYADSAGFANDYARPNAWRYRDYVIRSFNQDKPYSEFVRQQLAGDEIDHSNPDNIIATGFLRMGPWEQTAMSVFRITRQQWLDDVTDSVGQTFLAQPLQCCKCHDHKFDPLPTRDYYSMFAVFRTTQFAEPDTPFLPDENKTGFKSANDWIRAKIAGYQKQRNDLNKRVQQQRKKESGDARIGDNGLDPGDEASLARMGKNISRHNWEYDRTRPIALSVYTGKTIQRNNVGSRLNQPEQPWQKGEIEPNVILTGGNAFAPGTEVTPAPLSAAINLGKMDSVTFPSAQGKRRLALANWIVDEKNPLTARVIVNRVWSWHFGRGIAGNPNNFGATGSLPTHPKLLDYLAGWFVEHDWSIKKLNQLIITSRAYRRSSRHPDSAALDSGDPKRELYAVFRPRRLTAEELRDAMLTVSGELNTQVGGIPCRPDMNIEVAMQPRQIMGGTASVYEPDPSPTQRNRRSVYAEKLRGVRDPFLETFNQPGPDKSCELRETSTVAPQALTLMNAEEVQDRALAFANRLTSSSNANDSEVIDAAFELALGRRPEPEEHRQCLQHWRRASAKEESNTPEIKSFSARVERTVMAEKTGEPYTFSELMPAYENYEPDLQQHEVDARTRGLTQVCLVLFNLNEFAYLD